MRRGWVGSGWRCAWGVGGGVRGCLPSSCPARLGAVAPPPPLPEWVSVSFSLSVLGHSEREKPQPPPPPPEHSRGEPGRGCSSSPPFPGAASPAAAHGHSSVMSPLGLCSSGHLPVPPPPRVQAAVGGGVPESSSAAAAFIPALSRWGLATGNPLRAAASPGFALARAGISP